MQISRKTQKLAQFNVQFVSFYSMNVPSPIQNENKCNRTVTVHFELIKMVQINLIKKLKSFA